MDYLLVVFRFEIRLRLQYGKEIILVTTAGVQSRGE
jgi:hypothetical protein